MRLVSEGLQRKQSGRQQRQEKIEENLEIASSHIEEVSRNFRCAHFSCDFSHD